ncbi:leucyl aminopeptidase [Methylohalomonas lacus]|uniref:Probable cytosol aminopeptidase n=1 Tax=Methylohalomonas lacus TaxID=398773 RepID=A0AAE3L3I5_9GAMM|nr:leucyl aminopeptidase [Methylohalomonas lacus]MCS3902168.1 leucyl aminopeptidase [Methylohalomonas lacus]
MEFTIKSGNPEKQRSACIVVGVFEPRRLSSAARTIDQASERFLSNLVRRGDIEGKLGQTLLLHNVPGTLADRVLLIGCGKERELGETQYRRIIATMAHSLNDTGSMEAVCYLPEINVKGRDVRWKVQQAVLTVRDSLYRFEQLKSKKESARRPLRKVVLGVPTRRDLTAGEEAVEVGQAIADGVQTAKELANLPPNICNPTYLADQALELAKKYKSVDVKVLDEAAMEELGMGSLLSVAQGSEQPARLIVMEYRGGRKDEKPVAFVGKGVTFDTGGISIKPASGMDEMKYDMCGAASVFGAMTAVAELNLPINFIGLVPTVENMPGSKATRPGDIYTSMSGQTIEVLNTDAEGRLILCDALTYCEQYEPESVVDIATLTGACVVALGKHASGLFANHQALANDLLVAGRTIGDPAWQLPMWDEYQQALDSPFADMANVGGGRDGGAITAACFLSRFAKKFHWAHLDIAGTAWLTGKEKGATGRPVPLLVQYLLDRINER